MYHINNKLAMAICAIVYVCVVSCHSHINEKQDDDDHDHEENPFAVHFTKEMQSSVEFSVEEVNKRQIGSVIETVAQVQPSQGDETVICAKTDGVVKLNGKTLAVGSTISAGQAICSINASVTANNNLSAQQQQAQAEYQRAKAEYERLKSLRDDKLTLESEVANAKAAMESALSALKALQSGFAGGMQSVSSTTSGYLKQLMVQDGQYVQSGETVAVITKSQTLQLKAEVPVSNYSLLKDVCDANIMVGDEYLSVEGLGGRMLSYGRQTSGDSPLIPVTFEIKNVVDLVPGSYINMYIKTRSADERLCVPNSSLIEEMGNWFVYVQTSDDTFEKRQIKVGCTDGKYTESISGVKQGERIVSQGTMLVKLQQQMGSVSADHGHEH